MNSNLDTSDFVSMARDDWVAGMASSDPYSICFHAQQAVEKILKAFLAFHQEQIPRSHDIGDLLTRCVKIDQSLANLMPLADVLQPFGVEIRYSPSKERATIECPKVWSALDLIFDAIKQGLPGFAEMWRGE